MSVIHWDKSVLTLHLREVLEDHHRGDSLALVGLGAVVLGAIALPTTVKVSKFLVKGLIKTGLALAPQSTAPGVKAALTPAAPLPSTRPLLFEKSSH